MTAILTRIAARRAAAALAAAACLLATAAGCGDLGANSDISIPTPDTETILDAAGPDATPAQRTVAFIDAHWSGLNEAQSAALCRGVEQLGAGRFADLLTANDVADLLDRDTLAAYTPTKCR